MGIHTRGKVEKAAQQYNIVIFLYKNVTGVMLIWNNYVELHFVFMYH